MQKLILFLIGHNSKYRLLLFPGQSNLHCPGKKDGWKLLFDGKTTNGWHTWGKKTVSKAWSVKDGAFALDAEALKGHP